MSDADFRPEARVPRGFVDKRAPVLRAERAIVEAVSRVYERYGFEALDTGAFEYADALGKFLPDSDRPNEGVFALQDDPDSDGAGQWMALRYDLTAPLARFAAENWETLPKPFRRYAFGPVWRNEKPGPGRFRQFVQCDADTVGSARPEADAEMIAMAGEGLQAAGLSTADYVIKINNRKLLNGLLNDLLDIKDYDRAKAILEARRAAIGYTALQGAPDVVKISAIGIGMRSHSGVASRAFKALAEKGINIRAITTSEIKFSMLIDEAYTELAVRTLHSLYGLDSKA